MAISKEQLVIELKAKGINLTKAQLTQLDKTTKGATKSFGAMAAGIAGTTAALYLAGKAFSDVTKTGMKFEQSMANVKAISGATTAQFKSLEANAKLLGASTKFTASEVANLQTEYSKLGFTATEIESVTKGTLDLASAVGEDLAISAATAGATLRGFGMDTKETTRVTDVMAKSFSSSALDMDKFSNSMTYVAPVAKLAGFEIEGTTAILGQLANAGIDGSMAGTSLRRIFLELSNESSQLSKRLGGSVSSVDELIPALQKLNREGISTAEMKELVGQRSISAFSVLLDGAKDVDILAESFRNASGSAKEMADIQLDTLEGKFTILKSAMEGLKISLFDTFDEGLKGTVEDITNAVQTLTTNLEIQKLENYRLGKSWEGLTDSVKTSLLEQEIALKRQAIELEKQPGTLSVLGGLWMDFGRMLEKGIENVSILSAAEESLNKMQLENTKGIWESIVASQVNEETISSLTEEIIGLELQLKNVKGEWVEVTDEMAQLLNIDTGHIFLSDEDLEVFQAQLDDARLLAGDCVADLDDILEESSGMGDFLSDEELAKLKEALEKKVELERLAQEEARQQLKEHEKNMLNLGKDSRLIRLEDEKAQVEKSLNILGIEGEKREELMQQFADREKELQKTLGEEAVIAQEERMMALKEHALEFGINSAIDLLNEQRRIEEEKALQLENSEIALAEIRQKYADKEKDLRDQTGEHTVKSYVNYASKAMSVVSGFMNQYAAIQQTEIDAERKKLQEKGKTDAEIEKLLEDQTNKLKATRHKQALMAAFESAINAYNSLSAIPVVGPGLGVIAGAAALQFGLKQAEQIKQAEEGGLIGGKRHSQGGTIIEAEEGEYIMQRTAVSKYGSDMMDKINKGLFEKNQLGSLYRGLSEQGNMNSDKISNLADNLVEDRGANVFSYMNPGIDWAMTKEGLKEARKAEKFAQGGQIGSSIFPTNLTDVQIETNSSVPIGSNLTFNFYIEGNVLTNDYIEGELAEKLQDAVRKGVNIG